MSKYVIGLDFGTNSCRSLIVDTKERKGTGNSCICLSVRQGRRYVDAHDPNVARQNPADYLQGIESIVKGALKKARSVKKPFLHPT